jgi:hypothetical protein
LPGGPARPYNCSDRARLSGIDLIRAKNLLIFLKIGPCVIACSWLSIRLLDVRLLDV